MWVSVGIYDGLCIYLRVFVNVFGYVWVSECLWVYVYLYISDVASHIVIYIKSVSFICVSSCVMRVCVCVCVWLPGVVVTSRVLSSLLPGEYVWGESCPWLSWTQMFWTACTRWVVSETESSSHVICNAKSKHFLTLDMTVFLESLIRHWVTRKTVTLVQHNEINTILPGFLISFWCGMLWKLHYVKFIVFIIFFIVFVYLISICGVEKI